MKIIGCKIVKPVIALQEAHKFILTSLSCQGGHKVSLLVSPIVNFKIVINSENILCIQYIHLFSHNENTSYNFGICTLNIIRMRIEYIYHFSHNVHTPYNFWDLYIKQYKNENTYIPCRGKSMQLEGWQYLKL